jgi:transcriptional regulator GlxA family with amidase domain
MLRSMAALTLLCLLGSAASAQDDKKATPFKKRNVAIVIHDKVELLDFAGPGEVFQSALWNNDRAFNVYTVSEKTEPIISQGFLKVTPNYSVSDCPKPDIIVIPGGDTRLLVTNPAIMDWLKKSAPETEVMFSVCTGAFALGQLGLLDGKDATTHYSSITGLQDKFPKARVHRDRRVVDNGNVVTAAGVSAGIDGALHLVARLCDLDCAKRTAKYMEYKWEPLANATSDGK